jgi:hypothetical protein
MTARHVDRLWHHKGKCHIQKAREQLALWFKAQQLGSSLGSSRSWWQMQVSRSSDSVGSCCSDPGNPWAVLDNPLWPGGKSCVEVALLKKEKVGYLGMDETAKETRLKIVGHEYWVERNEKEGRGRGWPNAGERGFYDQHRCPTSGDLCQDHPMRHLG